MTPFFSVVIPLYNHERYVLEAIESVLAQTDTDFELIVVDDGSTDGSRAVVEELDDPRISYFFQENQGAHAAINRGIELARGEWVAILNSDDVFRPERLRVAREHIQTDPSMGALFTGYDFIGEDSAVVRAAAEIEERWTHPKASMSDEAYALITEKEEIVLRLLGGNFLHSTSNLIARREVLDAVGPFSSYRYVHDYDYFLRLAMHEKIVVDPGVLLQYRLHEGNTLSEDAAQSVYETGLVLVDFLSRHPLSVFAREDVLFFEAYRYLYDALRGYGAERMLLGALLARAAMDSPVEIADRLKGDSETRAFLLERLAQAAAQDAEQDRFQWQKEKADHWWKEAAESTRRAEESERELEWQREQTDIWWQRADERAKSLAEQDKILAEKESALVESGRSLEWQKGKTDLWWERAEERAAQLAKRDQSLAEQEAALEESRRSLEWQKEQTDNWWGESQKRDAQIALDQRWLGLGGVFRAIRARVAGLFR